MWYMRQLAVSSLYPRSTEGGMGVYWIHPDVCPSVRPSVDKFSGTFLKLLAQFISYPAFTLIVMGWVSWPLFIFVFLASFSVLWWPNICGKFLLFPNVLLKLLWYLKYHDNLVGKMMPKFFLNKVFLKNSHLCSTRLQNKNLYWIFLDEVGGDQSGGILSPFMGTACWFRLSLVGGQCII